jgi:hypothetical protein
MEELTNNELVQTIIKALRELLKRGLYKHLSEKDVIIILIERFKSRKYA